MSSATLNGLTSQSEKRIVSWIVLYAGRFGVGGGDGRCSTGAGVAASAIVGGGAVGTF